MRSRSRVLVASLALERQPRRSGECVETAKVAALRSRTQGPQSHPAKVHTHPKHSEGMLPPSTARTRARASGTWLFDRLQTCYFVTFLSAGAVSACPSS